MHPLMDEFLTYKIIYDFSSGEYIMENNLDSNEKKISVKVSDLIKKFKPK